MKLTELQLAVLVFVEAHGSHIDFGGRGANHAQLNAAKQLIYHGLLSGHYRNAELTPAGRAELEKYT